jgi:UDP-N-acetylglucosamine 1-carboxyvinyltransferase
VGKSIIYEALFSDRLKYLEQLNAMGAKTTIMDERRAFIEGPTKLKGAVIESVDLRAGATVVLAGLIAVGQTVVAKAEIIDRGYERIEYKLKSIGADIERVAN